MVRGAASPLLGRSEELQTIRSLVTNARNGLSSSLVLVGEPGIGKTAILTAATSSLTGVRLVKVDGIEAESAIPYAALHRIGVALADHFDELPARLRTALHVAWGIEDGPAPDRFLVGLAMLALCAAAGSHTPLVCVMDDAYLLDSESLAVLAFAARRLTAESTVMLFATRDTDAVLTALAGVPQMSLSGLAAHPSVELLRANLPDGVDDSSAMQIADSAGGNPLALIDLARDLSVGQLSDLAILRSPIPIGERLEAHYLRQVRDLSDDTQLWLLVAATAAGEQSALIATAAEHLGLSSTNGAEAARAGLVALGDTIAFRHPLVRSAVYGAASAGDRKRIHAALAEQADRLGLIDVAVWHQAESAAGPDPVIADGLEQAAIRAGLRGGLVSQAGLLAKAANLSATLAARNARLLSAAEIAGAAGAAQLSRELLDRIDVDSLDSNQRGRLLVAETAWGMFVADPRGTLRGTARLLEGAQQFSGDEPERKSRALLQAFEHALVAEGLMQDTTLAVLGNRAQDASDVGGPHGLVLEGIAAHILSPYHEALPHIRRAMQTLATIDDDRLPEFGFVGIAFAIALFDVTAGLEYLSRLARVARNHGALRALDSVLWVRSLFEIGRGDPATAELYIGQVRELRRAIGYDAENVVNVSYLAWTGSPIGDVEAIAELTRSMGFGGVHTAAHAALAAREIAEGRYTDAFSRLQRLISAPFLHVTNLQLADFVEAASRSGHPDDAQSTASVIASMAEVNESPWLRGLNERCQALLAPAETADEHFRRALAHLETVSVPVELGRTHLLYGEWLRRRKQRRLAREHLRTALSVFEQASAPAFAERARSELRATGEQLADRDVVAGVLLSPREATIARMAATGATNAEIAAQLFITANTVDYHLRKVFHKLGITSRRQLAERFSAPD